MGKEKSIKIVSAGGVGDLILGIQGAWFAKKAGYDVEVILSARDETFRPINYFFGNKFKLSQVPEAVTENHRILFDDQTRQQICGDCEMMALWPDLLFSNPFPFDWKRFGCSPREVRAKRLLEEDRFANWESPMIYVGLVSSTNGYVYHDIPNLILSLAREMPNYRIYFPLVTRWGNDQLNLGNFDIEFPKNVEIDRNPDIVDSLAKMKSAVFGVFTDNGPHHLAYQLNLNRTILDPRMKVSDLPWICRWRPICDDSISINLPVSDIVRSIKNSIKNIPIGLLPRVISLIEEKELNEKLLNKFPSN